MAQLGKRPKPHNKATKQIRRPLYIFSKSISQESADDRGRSDGAVPVEFDASVFASVSQNEKELLNAYIENLQRCIAQEDQEKIGASKIEVSVSEGMYPYKDLVFAIYVNVEAKEALRFWERIDERINSWLGTQPEPVRKTVLVQFSTDVHWK